eukprot:1752068-Pleurochrysis_carterae.AAC.1
MTAGSVVTLSSLPEILGNLESPAVAARAQARRNFRGKLRGRMSGFGDCAPACGSWRRPGVGESEGDGWQRQGGAEGAEGGKAGHGRSEAVQPSLLQKDMTCHIMEHPATAA